MLTKRNIDMPVVSAVSSDPNTSMVDLIGAWTPIHNVVDSDKGDNYAATDAVDNKGDISVAADVVDTTAAEVVHDNGDDGFWQELTSSFCHVDFIDGFAEVVKLWDVDCDLLDLLDESKTLRVQRRTLKLAAWWWECDRQRDPQAAWLVKTGRIKASNLVR